MPLWAENESNLPFDFLKKQVALVWRSGWDSNPRAVARKLISSQPRYDHFDTAANPANQAELGKEDGPPKSL